MRHVCGADCGGRMDQNPGAGRAVYAPVPFHHAGGASARRQIRPACRLRLYCPGFGRASDFCVGFAVGAFATGSIANRTENPGYRRLLAANFLGLGIVYLFGMVYCYLISNFYLETPIGLRALFLYSFLLTVPGDIVLCGVGAVLGKRLIPLFKKIRM